MHGKLLILTKTSSKIILVYSTKVSNLTLPHRVTQQSFLT